MACIGYLQDFIPVTLIHARGLRRHEPHDGENTPDPSGFLHSRDRTWRAKWSSLLYCRLQEPHWKNPGAGASIPSVRSETGPVLMSDGELEFLGREDREGVEDSAGGIEEGIIREEGMGRRAGDTEYKNRYDHS